MSAIVCPHCGVRLQIPDAIPPGRMLRCPKCQERFEAGASAAARPKPAVKRPVVQDDVDDEDEAPAAPRRKKKKKTAVKSGGSKLVLLLGVLGGVLACGAVLGILFLLELRDTRKQTIVDYNSNIKPIALDNAFGQTRPSGALGSGKIKPVTAWNQDLERAKKEALQKRKDLFVLFYGSDWCPNCKAMQQQILAEQSFWDFLDDKFVPVLLDFPQGDDAKTKVAHPEQNERLKADYHVTTFPVMVLMDAQGAPFEVAQGFPAGTGPGPLNAWLSSGLDQRDARNSAFAAIDKANGNAKLPAARTAYEILKIASCLHHYRSQLEQWVKLARQYDPRNAEGHLEFFTFSEWSLRPDSDDPKIVGERLAELVQWEKTFQFTDPNLGAHAYTYAALMHLHRKEIGLARKMHKRAQGYSVSMSDPEAIVKLHALQGTLTRSLGKRTGTGFVVTADGLLLTNRHVVDGADKLFVRYPLAKEPVPATIVAVHPTEDMALVRAVPPAGVKLAALTLAAERVLRRGEIVGAFGYPLGSSVGSGVKFSMGHVSALPEKETNGMLVLDSRVNPGNSGGPLCDPAGSVVGMVTAKTRSTEMVDSYGMALPANLLQQFLREQIPGYKAVEAKGTPKPWDQIDPLVSPSVVMILEGDVQP